MDINDRELLAKTLQAEAGNQGLGGMVAAGSVIMNRANTDGYGNGLRGVILKPGQFSAWNSLTGYAGGEQGQDMTAMRPSADAYKAADTLLSGGYTDPTGGATHYYNPSISQPRWGMGAGGDWKRIGAHVFGRADAGRGSQNQEIASQTMRALGKQPQISTRGQPMAMPQQQAQMPREEAPKGILEMLGVQRRDPTAQGQGALPFYQRDRFADTMGALATGFNQLRLRPDENLEQSVMASQEGRRQKAMANKTAEWLAQQPGSGAFVQMLSSGADPAKVLQAYQAAQANAAKAAQGSIREVDGRLVRVMPDDTVVEIMGGGSQKAPKVTTITRSDGSQVAVQWDETSGQWIPLSAPEGAIPIPTKLTEGQAKTTLFSSIQSQTAPVLDKIEQQWDPANIQDAAARATPIAGNYFTSPEGQIYKAASEAWSEGALRIATGAAATPAEKEAVIKTYFAQPGDTPGTITFKNNLRKAYEEAINASLGQSTGYKLPVPLSFGGTGTLPPTDLPDPTSVVGEGATNAGATGTGVQWKVVE